MLYRVESRAKDHWTTAGKRIEQRRVWFVAAHDADIVIDEIILADKHAEEWLRGPDATDKRVTIVECPMGVCELRGEA